MNYVKEWTPLDNHLEVFTERLIGLGLEQDVLEKVISYSDELLTQLLKLSELEKSNEEEIIIIKDVDHE